MAWCPVCKCEYKKGILKCAECKVDLVDSLEDNKEEALVPNEELSEEIVMELAKELNENKEIHFTDRDAEIPAVRIAKKAGVYRNSKELSNENKSSAYILLPVGILGVVALVLVWLDVIPLYSGIVSKIITSVVMGSLFVVFIVMGIVSLKNAKKLDEKADEEGDLTKEIFNFFSENYSVDILDEKICDSQWSQLPEEEKYFKRIECIKTVLVKQFMNLEENYIDFISDEIYTKFYEE